MRTIRIKPIFRSIKNTLKRNPDRFLNNISGVIHIGANLGQERHLYEEKKLNVLWIEPITDVYGQLLSNIEAFGNQIAVQALVTDEDNQEYKFNIANNNGASSSIYDFKDHKDIWPTVKYSDSVILTSVTLATLIKQEKIDISKYQALVMDTQGSELLVLQGSHSILSNFRYIKTEVPDFESYDGCCQLEDVSKYLNEQGFIENSRTKLVSRVQGGSYFDIVYERTL